MATNDMGTTSRGIQYPTNPTQFASADWWKRLADSVNTAIGEAIKDKDAWMKGTPASKEQLDGYITAANSGVYPVGQSVRESLGIPSGPSSGWVTVVYVHSAAVAQQFNSLTGEVFYRAYTGSTEGWSPWTPGGGSGAWQYPPRAAEVPSTKGQIDALVKLEDAGVYPVNRAVRSTLGIPEGNASGWLTVVYVNSTAVAHRFSSLTGEELYRNYSGSVSGWTPWRATGGGGGGTGSGLQARTSVETTGEWTTVPQMRSYLDEMAKHPRARLVTVGTTVNGASIPALIIGDSTKPAFLAVGGQHGNELGNTHGLMVWARQLLEGASQLHLDMCFLIVPMLNIDNWMTKRENANNVDLNRDWIAFTQPETKAVRDWIAGFNVIGAVDGHSFGYPRQVSMKTPTRGTTELKAKAKQLYDAIGAAVVADGQFFRTYDVANHDGMMPEGMMELGIPSLFTEIPSGYGKTDEEVKISPNWQQRMAALTMNAAAHEVWKWTPTYPSDLVPAGN